MIEFLYLFCSYYLVGFFCLYLILALCYLALEVFDFFKWLSEQGASK